MTNTSFWMHVYANSWRRHGRHVAWRKLKRLGVHLPNPSRSPTELVRMFIKVAKAFENVAKDIANFGAELRRMYTPDELEALCVEGEPDAHSP